MELTNKIEKTRADFIAELGTCDSEKCVQDIHTKYLGRKAGLVTGFFAELGKCSPEERPLMGKNLNELKGFIQGAIKNRAQKIKDAQESFSAYDLSLPGRSQYFGKLHPLTLVMNEMIYILEGMGFEVATGPEIESDFYNFSALNFPDDHPARDIQDTFYLDDGNLLRTHTSPVQIRVMEQQQPPVRIIAPGRVFRKDTPDATHSPIFHQVEGLYVDRDVTLAELKGTLLAFAHAMFGPEIDIRFRSGFFPFTEPSVEYDFTCVMCRGKGCSVCKGSGWIEISGAGMVDPEVFKSAGIDPEAYTGYAWGMGVERIAMLKYRIPDLRLFYENDIRFNLQF